MPLLPLLISGQVLSWQITTQQIICENRGRSWARINEVRVSIDQWTQTQFKQKTVVFVIYEGKDTMNNLQTVLQQHANSLREITALKNKVRKLPY